MDVALIFAGIKAVKQVVVEGIATLDEVIPEGGQGQAKLNILKGWVEHALAAEEKFSPVASIIWTFLGPIITAICVKRKSSGG